MKFVFDVKPSAALNAKFDAIRQQIADFRGEVMSTLADFQVQLADIKAEAVRIGARMEELLSQLNRTDLTAEEEAAVLAEMASTAALMKTIGVKAEEPPAA